MVGLWVVGGDEVIDGLPQLGDAREAGGCKRLAAEDAEPDLDLIELGGMGRREVEMHPRMGFEPAVFLGLVSGEVIEVRHLR